MKKKRNTLQAVIGSAIAIASFMIITPLIEECSRKAYRRTLKSKQFNFDNMGPEINRKQK